MKTILITGANGQLGNEMRIIAQESPDKYIFTDVNQVEGVETIYLDITDLEAIRKMVADNNIDAIVNCAAWANVVGAEDPEKYYIEVIMQEKISLYLEYEHNASFWYDIKLIFLTFWTIVKE